MVDTHPEESMVIILKWKSSVSDGKLTYTSTKSGNTFVATRSNKGEGWDLFVNGDLHSHHPRSCRAKIAAKEYARLEAGPLQN